QEQEQEKQDVFSKDPQYSKLKETIEKEK
ncbi:MAG: hypothetical protein RLZZ152_1671, partial [Pseudomonadota bacterium]